MVYLSKLSSSLCSASFTIVRKGSNFPLPSQTMLRYLTTRKSTGFSPSLHCRFSSLSATKFAGFNPKPSTVPVTPEASIPSSNPDTSTEVKKDETVPPPPPEPKKSMKEKLEYYLRNLYRDYREVTIDTVKDAKAKPRKAAFYLALLGGVLYSIWSNPEERQYFQDFTENRDTFEMCAKPLRNPDTEAYFEEVSRVWMKGMVRYQSCGLFSITYRDNEDPMVGLFSAQNDYLKPMLSEMWDRLLDVGFLGKWWVLEKKMVDYDVNYLEWDEAAPSQSNPILTVTSMLNQAKIM